MIWSKYRAADGQINLVGVYKDFCRENNRAETPQGISYLTLVQRTQHIKSRQAATLAITTACFLAHGGHPQ